MRLLYFSLLALPSNSNKSTLNSKIKTLLQHYKPTNPDIPNSVIENLQKISIEEKYFYPFNHDDPVYLVEKRRKGIVGLYLIKYKKQLKQGILEGSVTEALSVILHDTTTGNVLNDSIHLAVKAIAVDLSRGIFESDKKFRMNFFRVASLIVWPIIIRSLFHVVPAIAVHFSVEEVETGFDDFN